jgi:plastocyanin
MDMLDSRSLRYSDCFMQKFAMPGTVRYRLTTPAGACLPIEEEGAYTIEVATGAGRPEGEGRQHNVLVGRKDGRLVADPPQLRIEAGDAVLWHAPDAAIIGWSVQGEGDGGAFSSAALRREAVYTHAFGTPGEYKWVDANEGRVSGTVIVRMLDSRDAEQCRKWLAALEEGAMVEIDGDTVKPEALEIVAGQTVFWAVHKAGGITITDARLAGGEN